MLNLREDQRRCLFQASPVQPPPEPNTRTQAKWKSQPARIYKYVDDAIISDWINTVNADVLNLPDGIVVKEKHAVLTQNAFRTVVGKAEWKGMRVNTAKTTMMCVSAGTSFIPRAFFLDSEGNRASSDQTETKLLGFPLPDKPGGSAHIDALRRKFRRLLWVIITRPHPVLLAPSTEAEYYRL